RGSREPRPTPALLPTVILVVVLIVVIATIAVDLSADFARRQRRRMDVGVGGVRGQGVDERVEVIGQDVLRGDGQNVRAGEGARHRPGIHRAGLRAGRGRGDV